MKIIIVGAGLAGLTCAKVLRERPAEVVVLAQTPGLVLAGEYTEASRMVIE